MASIFDQHTNDRSYMFAVRALRRASISASGGVEKFTGQVLRG
jgi:hypothetical protein